MKKNLILLVLILSSSLFTFCRAQQDKGEIIINAGVGYSPQFNGATYGFPAQTYIGNPSSYPYPGFSCSSIIPNLGGAVDVGLSKLFSIGMASSYQGETVTWTTGDNNKTPYPFSDKITRINIAFRLLYHLPWTHDRFDPYIGIRPGCCLWHDVASSSNSLVGSPPNPMTFMTHPNSPVPSFQVLCGMRFYLTDNFGVHFEAGVGPPYLIEGGLTLRLNTYTYYY